jgi:hypothetical protein
MTQTPKAFMAFRPDPEMARAMRRLTVRDGIPISEQIRRALRDWLTKKRVYIPKKEKK